MGEDIEIEKMEKKDRMEEIFDYVMPNVNNIGGMEDKYALMDAWELLSEEEQKSEKGIKLQAEAFKMLKDRPHPMSRTIRYLLLNADEYKFYNPMTLNYFNAAKEGKLRDNMVRFWRFNWYMFCTGRYYDIVGTSPQDGEHKGVMKVLEVATKVLGEELKERRKWEEEDEALDNN